LQLKLLIILSPLRS